MKRVTRYAVYPSWHYIGRMRPHSQGDPNMTNLTFNVLRAANLARVIEFRDGKGRLSHAGGVTDWSPADWMLAILGELGELANLLKKVKRGDFDSDDLDVYMKVSNELADVQTYLDLLAARLDVNLGEATVRKFNAVSTRVGANVFIHLDGGWSHK